MKCYHYRIMNLNKFKKKFPEKFPSEDDIFKRIGKGAKIFDRDDRNEDQRDKPYGRGQAGQKTR